MASIPVISYPIKDTHIYAPYIFGSRVYLAFVPDDIIIWNWKTGELVFVSLVTTTSRHFLTKQDL